MWRLRDRSDDTRACWASDSLSAPLIPRASLNTISSSSESLALYGGAAMTVSPLVEAEPTPARKGNLAGTIANQLDADEIASSPDIAHLVELSQRFANLLHELRPAAADAFQ